MGKNSDTLFDWLVRRAEADLGVAQALAAGENQRADQIKRLETILIGQINKLQQQIVESREAELNDLRSEIFACDDRIARFEGTQSTGDAAKQVAQELGDLRAQLVARQTELETRYSEFEKLGESLGAHLCALEEELRDKLEAIRNAHGEMRHFQSETQSLAERLAHAESATWQARTLALRNAQQLEETTESLRCEIVALNALFADFNDKQASLRLPDTLLDEIAQNLGAKIEEIHDRLTHAHNTQLERDLRLGQLDSGLAMLAERLTRAESLSHQTHSLTQGEVNSASDFRKATARELAALQVTLNEAAVQQSAIQEIQSSLRAKAEEWQHQTAQKFMLLDSRDAEREKSARELAATLTAKLAEQAAHTDEQLRAMASDHEELCRLRPDIQTLAARIADAESESEKAHAEADASIYRTAQLQDGLKNEIAALNAEIVKLADQQRAFSLPEDQLGEIERTLAFKVDEIQRQLAIEREGFDHWGKGLRESFGAELSTIQARLSERQSQIEHRYGRFEHWDETVKASLDRLETQFKEKLQSCSDRHEQWDRLQSELGILGERTSQLETATRQAKDQAAAITRNSEQSVAVLQREISALETSFDQRKLPTSDSIIYAIEEKLGDKLREIEGQLTRQLGQYDSRFSERTRQSEQIVNRVQSELAVLSAALGEKQTAAPPAVGLSTTVEESLWMRIRELDQQLAARFSQVDSRDAERTQCSNNLFETLQSELAAIKTSVTERTVTPAESSMRSLEESIGTKMQELQQHLAQQLSLFEKRDVERTQRAEQAIADFKSEMAALNGELIQRPAAMSLADPVLRGIEETFIAKIEELRQQMGEKFSAFDSREADLNELKERSQSLIQRVTQLSATIQSSRNTAVSGVQPMTPRLEVSAAPAPAVKGEGEDNLEIQAHSEKDQLIKLQERMSSEIERVRAELKERSGRWKVRKSAS
jgi:DNA repair exonuclease SbcCD ATPase subunit